MKRALTNFPGSAQGMRKKMEEKLEVQKQVVKLQLKQCIEEISPFLERVIGTYLRDACGTHCMDTARIFGHIQQTLKRMHRENVERGDNAGNMGDNAVAAYSRELLRSDPKGFFASPNFRFPDGAPMAEQVEDLCEYYMKNRGACDKKGHGVDQTPEVRDRRDLMIRMMRKLSPGDDADPRPSEQVLLKDTNERETDIIYRTAYSDLQMLVENPNAGALYFFDCSDAFAGSRHRPRIFALFRGLWSHVTQREAIHDPVTQEVRARVWPQVGEHRHLKHPKEDFRKVGDKTIKGKAWKNFELLGRHPAMKADLMKADLSERPSLNKYLCFKQMMKHTKTNLVKAVFVEALEISQEVVKKVEKDCIDEITEIRRRRLKAGEVEEMFAGGSKW